MRAAPTCLLITHLCCLCCRPQLLRWQRRPPPEFALDGYADGYANGGDVSDSSNDSDAATTTDLHLRGGASISQGQFGRQSGSYRVDRRSAGHRPVDAVQQPGARLTACPLAAAVAAAAVTLQPARHTAAPCMAAPCA